MTTWKNKLLWDDIETVRHLNKILDKMSIEILNKMSDEERKMTVPDCDGNCLEDVLFDYMFNEACEYKAELHDYIMNEGE